MLDFGFYNMDCMDGMKEFPDGFFDLAIVDPPYGIKADKGTGGFGDKSLARHYTSKWDDSIPSAEYFDELKRISKNQIIFGAQYMIEHLNAGTKWLVWDKVGTVKFQNPYSKCELAYTSFSGAVDKFFYMQMGYFTKNKDQRIHPTQKPVDLYKYILEHYAKPGDKILDTHVGSASSLVACRECGFKYVGFEIDEDYFREAKKRLDAAEAQANIFDFIGGTHEKNNHDLDRVDDHVDARPGGCKNNISLFDKDTGDEGTGEQEITHD